MKKNFFKKLSFVLALAMVMSVIAPAASAFAAAAPKLNSTKKYLHLDVDKLNEFDFNVANKKTGWKYNWESSNENVVVVDAKGIVTATGAGTAKVSVVITDKKGEVVKTLKATVVVRDNIKTLTIANAPEGDKVAIGEEFDFNRSYVTVAGNKKGSASITRWTVEPTTGATIKADSGLFVATEPGKYTVTAKAYQSAAKYAEGVAIDGAVATYELTVVPSLKEVKQLNPTKATLVFDADMSKELTKDNLKVYRVIAGTTVAQDVPMLVKEVKFNAAGTEATVEMYVAFVAESNYKFVYGTMKGGFLAAKADAKEVTSVELGVKEIVWKDGAATLTTILKNKDGVDISGGIDKSRVEYKLENNVGYLNGDKLVMFKTGDVATIKVIFHTWTYDSNYKEITIEEVFNVTAVDAASYTLAGNAEWTFFKNGVPTKDDWSKSITKTLAAGDSGYRVFARVKSSNTSKTEYYYSYTHVTLDNAAANAKAFTFSTSNADVLYVDAQGNVYPIKAGEAVIICYYDGKAVDTFAVKVEEARKVVSVTLKDDKNVVTLSNSSSVKDTASVTIVLKDQLGANVETYDSSKFEVKTLLSSPQGTSSKPVVNPLTFTNDGSNLTINLTGNGATKGTWSYLITAYGVSTVLTVNIQEPSNNDIAYYKLTTDKTSYDTAVAKDAAVKTATVTLLGYADNGVANFKADWSKADYSYTITDANGTPITDAAFLDGAIEIAQAGATIKTPTKAVSGPAITAISGSSVTKMAKGTYYLTAKKGTDVVAYTNFTVVDTTAAATFELKNVESTATTVLQAVRDAIDVSLGGTKIADEDLFNVVYAQGASLKTDATNDAATQNGTLYVKSVDFITSFYDDNAKATFYVKYTVNVDRNITIK